jgi:uncharacterized protein YndB with AHSA1/START domain
MKTIQQSYVIHAPLAEVWKALVDPAYIEKWGGGPAKMSDQLGAFSIWGGEIHGTNTEVVSERKLVQDWTAGKWKEPSKVVFTLSSTGDDTKLELLQEKIPDEDFKEIEHGWTSYYLGPMKKFLEQNT